MKHLTIAEVAERIGMTEKAIRQRIGRKQFPHRYLGSRIIVDEAELQKFIESLPGCTAAEALKEIGNG